VSTVAAEARWFLVNYLLLNAVCFVFAVLDGLVLMATYGGSIPGWDGSPVQQLLFYALTFVMFLPFVFGIPVLLVALLAWRLAIRLGHPRLTAYLVATIMVVGAALLIERPSRCTSRSSSWPSWPTRPSSVCHPGPHRNTPA